MVVDVVPTTHSVDVDPADLPRNASKCDKNRSSDTLTSKPERLDGECADLQAKDNACSCGRSSGVE